MEQHKDQGHLAAPSGPVPSALTVDAARPVAEAGPMGLDAPSYTPGVLVSGRTFNTHDHPRRYWRTYVETDAQFVAQTFGATQEEAEANAARIVKCVNNFDAPVEALREIVKTCDDPAGSQSGESLACAMARLLPAARAALKQAEAA